MLNFFDSVSCETIIAENEAYEQVLAMVRLLLKCMIYASFYVIVIKTSMDFYEYKRFPKLYEQNSAPWYTEALLYSAASLFVIVVYAVLRGIVRRKIKKG